MTWMFWFYLTYLVRINLYRVKLITPPGNYYIEGSYFSMQFVCLYVSLNFFFYRFVVVEVKRCTTESMSTVSIARPLSVPENANDDQGEIRSHRK